MNKFLAILLTAGLVAGAAGAVLAQESDVAQAGLSASITGGPSDGDEVGVNTDVTFSASASGGEPPYAYTWDFGDGNEAFGQSYTHQFSAAGDKTITLTVTDFAGDTSTDSINLTVTVPATPLGLVVSAPVDNSEFNVGEAITFTASASGGEPPYAYTWDFGDGTDSIGLEVTKTYDAAGDYTAVVEVTDFAGQAAVASVGLTITNEDNGDDDDPPGGDEDDKLTISDIQVTEVTENSAVIRWQTNKPANSRVIYDSVSHPDISSAAPPNFGYAFSTATFNDESKVTEHEVELTGLSPDTTYFFRVISQ